MPVIIFTYLVQIALIVHVLRTGRNTYWVIILLIAPLRANWSTADTMRRPSNTIKVHWPGFMKLTLTFCWVLPRRSRIGSTRQKAALRACLNSQASVLGRLETVLYPARLKMTNRELQSIAG